MTALPWPAPVAAVVGYEMAPARAGSSWVRGVRVALQLEGVTYAFGVNAEELVGDCGLLNIDEPITDWDPIARAHSIFFRGCAYYTSDAPPLEARACALAALRGIAHWMREAGVDLWQIQHAWGADRPRGQR